MHNQDSINEVDSLVFRDYDEFKKSLMDNFGLTCKASFLKLKNFKSKPIHLVYGQENFDSLWTISDRYQSGEVEYSRVN